MRCKFTKYRLQEQHTGSNSFTLKKNGFKNAKA